MKLFDRILWRINGVLLLGAVLLVGVLGLFAAYKIFKDETRDRNVRNIVMVDEETKEERGFRLGNFRRTSGTAYFSAPLFSEESIDRGSYSKSSSSTRNYFFYDSGKNTSHWLFPENKYLIHDRHEITQKLEDKKWEKVIGYIYTIIQADSNSDNRLTRNDEKTIYISGVSGKTIKPIITEVVSVLGIHQLNEKLVSELKNNPQISDFKSQIEMSFFIS